ncbi:MAG: zeta toxin [Bacteroides sp.]|nr:zeta toxin [Bacteroides sp.]
MQKPNLYIIAGCNGAGKTTASFNVLPQILRCREFVNADEIAKGLSPFCPESVAIQAGKLMLERIDSLLTDNVSFAIETTLATRSYKNLVLRAKEKGYNVSLLFFWLESPELACQRVHKRVSEGGHDIPVDTIYRRYWLGIENLFRIFIPIVDDWSLYDNNNHTNLVADSNGIVNNEIYTKINNTLCQRKNNWK